MISLRCGKSAIEDPHDGRGQFQVITLTPANHHKLTSLYKPVTMESKCNCCTSSCGSRQAVCFALVGGDDLNWHHHTCNKDLCTLMMGMLILLLQPLRLPPSALLSIVL